MAALTNPISETIAFAEVEGKAYSQPVAEAFTMWEFMPATPLGLVGDLGIYNTAMSAAQVAEFIQNRAPIGYSRFRDFVAGNYKFQKAYIDFVFTPLDAADATLTLTKAKVYADVPDVIESNTGTVTVAGTGLTVSFAKTFKVAPKVTVTPIGAAATQAVLTAAPTTANFTVKLYNQAGTAITGSFIWTAMGY